jgi:GntR family hexuronate regulon transcriptional repressor
MVDTTGPSTLDQEVEIAALTFECRLAVEAAVMRTKQMERIPASPTMRAELDRVGKILEQMADAFEHLHGAITRLVYPRCGFAQAELPAASHRDIEEIGAAILAADRPLGGYAEEAELARSLRKGRSVVRDAAIWLEGRGLVKRMGDHGVRPNSFTETDLRELFEIREVFEPIACGLAAAAMSEEEIACLESEIEPRSHLGRGPNEEAGHSYNDFHIQIILGSKNTSLIELLSDNLHYKIRFYRDSFGLRPDWHETAIEERRQIVDALARRDGGAAAEAMRHHLASTRAATVWTGKLMDSCKVEDFAAHRRARRMLPI